jgi:hypothetical protein
MFPQIKGQKYFKMWNEFGRAWWLFAIHRGCLLFTGDCLLFTGGCLLFTSGCLLLTGACLPLTGTRYYGHHLPGR